MAWYDLVTDVTNKCFMGPCGSRVVPIRFFRSCNNYNLTIQQQPGTLVTFLLLYIENTVSFAIFDLLYNTKSFYCNRKFSLHKLKIEMKNRKTYDYMFYY